MWDNMLSVTHGQRRLGQFDLFDVCYGLELAANATGCHVQALVMIHAASYCRLVDSCTRCYQYWQHANQVSHQARRISAFHRELDLAHCPQVTHADGSAAKDKTAISVRLPDGSVVNVDDSFDSGSAAGRTIDVEYREVP